jgi:DNA-directed RNA polymerase subunit F
MNLKEAIEYAQELGLDPEHLDETIHELKSIEAAKINNGGLEEQISYLLGFMYFTSEEDIKSMLEKIAEEAL